MSTRLEDYLAFVIHGRKPPRRASKPQRHGPPRDEAYKAWIRTLPSAVSGLSACEAAHTGTDGGTAEKASDYSCVPLTSEEHREQHRIGMKAFARKYRLNYARIAAQLNREWWKSNAA